MTNKILNSVSPGWLIVAFSLFVHLPGITSPMLDYHAYRQCQTASMARNYARHGMHFLSPELDTEGTPVRAGTEFPIYSYLLAILFKFLGTREIWGHLLSAVFGAWGAVFLYELTRPRLGETRAMVSALVMCVLPIHIYFTRTVQPEPMALWGLLGFVFYWGRWLAERKRLDWILAVALGALGPLLKLPFGYVLFPLAAYLCWEKYGWRFLRQADCVIAGGAILGLTWAWYHYAKTAPVGILPLTASEHLENIRPILTFRLWRSHFISRIPELCLTYPGLLFAGVGAYTLRQERALRVWGVWFAATALYIVLLGQYGLTHRYTELPWAPINAVFIASGIVALWTRNVDITWRRVLMVLVIGIPIHAGFRIAHWYRWEYPWVFQAREAVAKVCGPDELIITHTAEHPVLLYYLDRYGFAPSLEETGLNVLSGYRARGARIFLTPTDEGWARHPEWKAVIDKEARLLTATPDFLIYQLN